MFTIPNILTLFRLFLLLPMIGLFFSSAPWAIWTCFVLYVIGAATDWVDGWVARKFNQISEFGIFLDPLSDKIYVVTIMLMLVATGRIESLWVVCVVVILIREFTVAGVREYLGPKGVKVPVTRLAKWKTATQMTAIAALILTPLAGWIGVIGLILLLAATALTVVTGWGYLRVGLTYMR